jgi:pimeloyl-ACP methyl ester carboxylesterase
MMCREVDMKSRFDFVLSGAAAATIVALIGCSPTSGAREEKYTRAVVQTPAGPIEYVLRGEGPVILKVVGAMENCESTMGNAALSKAGFSILVPSRPGYGKTPLSVGQTSIEAANAMASLLAELGISKVDVIAISSGGPTGLYLASRHPALVHRLILEDAVSKSMKELDPERYENGKKTYSSGYGLTRFMLKALARVAPKALARTTMNLFGTHDPNEAVKEMSRADVAEIGNFYLRWQASWAQGALNDMEQGVAADVLNSITAQTLIVHSREDKAVPFAAAEYSHANIAGSVLWEAPSWSHFISIGHGSSEVDMKVVEFLKG